MKIIAHRGNLHGPSSKTENSPNAVDECIKLGIDVEIDLWCINEELFLGHDEPTYPIEFRWLRDRISHLWIHCKNLESLDSLSKSSYDFNFFWHQEDDFTLTSHKYIWTYPGKLVTEKSVIVDKDCTDNRELIGNCYGICTDYALEYKAKHLESQYYEYVYSCGCVEDTPMTFWEFAVNTKAISETVVQQITLSKSIHN